MNTPIPIHGFGKRAVSTGPEWRGTGRFHDLLWRQDDPEVAALYPDKIVAVHQRKVWAAGDDWEAVRQEAAKNAGLPPETFVLTTIFGDELFLMDF